MPYAPRVAASFLRKTGRKSPKTRQTNRQRESALKERKKKKKKKREKVESITWQIERSEVKCGSVDHVNDLPPDWSTSKRSGSAESKARPSYISSSHLDWNDQQLLQTWWMAFNLNDFCFDYFFFFFLFFYWMDWSSQDPLQVQGNSIDFVELAMRETTLLRLHSTFLMINTLKCTRWNG